MPLDISFSDEHEAFREEVRVFLGAALSEELKEAQRLCPGIFLDYEHNIRWHRILHRQGWVAPSWPRQYGGTGWDLMRRYIWALEASTAEAPSLAPMGLGMCGPMLIGHGTKAQQAELLPRILSGEDYWCQGYSEPGAGSDLAALQLSAESDGQDYVLNGAKIWTTHAHYANKMFCLVRTSDRGRPQQGVTFLLLDMASPGIWVEPILFASGAHEVNQVFFDDVRVPKANVVGEENQGWAVAKYLLEFERGGGGLAGHQAPLERIRRLAENTAANGGALIDDADFRGRLDALDVKLQAAKHTEFRIMAALSKGENPGPESSIMKNLSANISQALTELALEALGAYIAPSQVEALRPGRNVEPVGPGAGVAVFSRYFNLRAVSIAGGTNEVQKNIVAKLVLGL